MQIEQMVKSLIPKLGEFKRTTNDTGSYVYSDKELGLDFLITYRLSTECGDKNYFSLRIRAWQQDWLRVPDKYLKSFEDAFVKQFEFNLSDEEKIKKLLAGKGC